MYSAGLSVGDNSDKLRSGLRHDVVKFIHDVSGAAASDTERQYLEEIMPQTKMTRQAFENAMKAVRSFAMKTANEKRRAAGQSELADDMVTAPIAKSNTSAPPVVGQPPANAPAPHGDAIEQDGVTYKWNGTDYVPAE